MGGLQVRARHDDPTAMSTRPLARLGWPPAICPDPACNCITTTPTKTHRTVGHSTACDGCNCIDLRVGHDGRHWIDPLADFLLTALRLCPGIVAALLGIIAWGILTSFAEAALPTTRLTAMSLRLPLVAFALALALGSVCAGLARTGARPGLVTPGGGETATA